MDKNLANFLSELRNKALETGASDATIIDAKFISIEKKPSHIVFNLIQDVGWEIYPITRDSGPDDIPNGVLAGLVLVA